MQMSAVPPGSWQLSRRLAFIAPRLRGVETHVDRGGASPLDGQTESTCPQFGAQEIKALPKLHSTGIAGVQPS